MISKSHWMHVCLVLIILAVVSGCQAKKPILIGYSAELSGRTGELGVDGRDGAQLAVDNINAQGGVDGRPLQMIVKDDRGDPQTARQVDQELIQENVTAIIGHLTSAMTEAVFQQNNAAGMVMISPTTSSSDFTGKADLFFRVIPDTNFLGRALADYIYLDQSISHTVGVYDLRNASYASAWWTAFRARYQELGGTIDHELPYRSGEIDLHLLAGQLATVQPQAVVFVASAFDCALILQYARHQMSETRFFSAAWAVTNELLTKGGRNVDGIELESVYNPSYDSPAYLQFTEQYLKRFARKPSLAASHSYEAVLVLAEALRKTGGEKAGLPEALVQIKKFTGIQGEFTMDAYGDVQRIIFIVTVNNGQFEVKRDVIP